MRRVTWKTIRERAHAILCPACGRNLNGAETEECDRLYYWHFHPACLAPLSEGYAVLTREMRQKESRDPMSSILKCYESVEGWSEMSQSELGELLVKPTKIVGTSSQNAQKYTADWYPSQSEMDARYERILFPAYVAYSIGDKKTVGEFLDSLGYKHLFYFPKRRSYYVCIDGNRRTSVARMLGVKWLHYDVTQVDK